MNRIYQGRVSKVETQDVNQQWQLLQNWEGELWLHHALFQDAVNYYITAIAALGSSPDSPLTRLQALLREVWDSADKKGQKREGMGKSFQRVWQLDKPPSLDEVVGRFRQPLLGNGVTPLEMELAGESLLHDLGGSGSIQKKGRQYFPLFCRSGFAKGCTFPRQKSELERKKVQKELPEKLWAAQNEKEATELLAQLNIEHFCIVDEDDDATNDDGVEDIEELCSSEEAELENASEVLSPEKTKKLFSDALNRLMQDKLVTEAQKGGFEKLLEQNIPVLPPHKGTSLNKDALKQRFYAFLLAKYLCGYEGGIKRMAGLEILRATYKEPKKKTSASVNKETEKAKIERWLCSLPDDPIKLTHEKAQIVFRAFSALPIWTGVALTKTIDGTVESIDKKGNKKTKTVKTTMERTPELHERSAYKHEILDDESYRLFWGEFDIAAFKEALKVWSQFKQNVEKREAKLDDLARRLLVMNGENAMADYNDEKDNPADSEDVRKRNEITRKIRERLKRIWHETGGKPKMPKADNDAEEARIPSFADDPRIERLRKIINADLAQEHRLTEGRKTAYGLRRRTMKGWDIVKREWRKIVKPGEVFSETKQQALREKLNTDLRGDGKTREQIGSESLFLALISDEAAWQIWREPTAEEQARIDKNNWAQDSLEAFREYKETCDALDEISARPLRFTPADAKFSRRLFMFTDVCSFGKERGEYKHDLKNLAVTVPVAVKNDTGKYSVTTRRLVYSAPRLLRDRIREIDGTYEQDWTQPMMRALFGHVADGKANPQQLADAAVALMPDFDNKGERRFLLNFPLTLDEAKIKAKIGKEQVWLGKKNTQGKYSNSQFASWKKGTQFPHLLWEGESSDKAKVLHYWWEKLSAFRVLSADLGTRHTASVALIECGKERKTGKEGAYRSIGKAGGADWFARFVSGTVLRLPGEDAQVLRPRAAKDIGDDTGKAFREELYGERGRSASVKETQATVEILTALGQEKMLEGGVEKFSFPEQNDKLLVAVRRTQGWIADCVSWLWKLKKPEQPEQPFDALLKFGEQERIATERLAALQRKIREKNNGKENKEELKDAWKELVSPIGAVWNNIENVVEQQFPTGEKEEKRRIACERWHTQSHIVLSHQIINECTDLLRKEVECQRICVQNELLRLTHRILPLRGRGWEWVKHPDYKPKKDSTLGESYLLRQTAGGTGPEKVLLAGQRGLSIARIEQLSELRRRWQSLNQSLRVSPGERPPTAVEMRDESIPDPCPDILEKLENIREQRVNQTAHLILAEALGLKLKVPEMSAEQRRATDTRQGRGRSLLKPPEMSAEQRRATDTHGEYEVVSPPVDFIVLEDLSRYLSDQGRTKRENSRLMKWCHRQITAKLKMLAEPFGLPVLETNAAYTSRFCSLTGAAGFRAVEVGLKNKTDFRWRTLLDLETKTDADGKPLKITPEKQQEIAHAKKLFADLERMEKNEHKNPTLLAPQPGGPIFVTAKEVKHPIPVRVRFEALKKKFGEEKAKKKKPDENIAPMQADINAAVNIGLRAIAHPACADIHHRIRTNTDENHEIKSKIKECEKLIKEGEKQIKKGKRKPDGDEDMRKEGLRKKEEGEKGKAELMKLLPVSFTREARRFGKEQIRIVMCGSDSMPKEKDSNLFYDQVAVAPWGRARLEVDGNETSFPYATGPALWKTVNDWHFQWTRCEAVNTARFVNGHAAKP